MKEYLYCEYGFVVYYKDSKDYSFTGYCSNGVINVSNDLDTVINACRNEREYDKNKEGSK